MSYFKRKRLRAKVNKLNKEITSLYDKITDPTISYKKAIPLNHKVEKLLIEVQTLLIQIDELENASKN